MLICPKCRTVYEDGAAYCIKCGNSLVNMQDQNAGQNYYTYGNSNGQGQQYSYNDQTGQYQYFVPDQLPGNELPGKKPKKFLLIPVILAALLAVFIGIRVFMRSSDVVDLEKCVTVAFTGYDGDGMAIMTINTKELADQIRAAKGKDADNYDPERMAEYVKLNGTVKEHAESEDGSIDEYDDENALNHLRRGDIITVTIDYSELQQRYTDLEFSGKSKDVEVEDGLKDYTVIDPFLHIKPAFSGTAPFGIVGLESIPDEIPAELIGFDSISWYELNKVKNIDIGDTLVLTFTQNGKNSWKEKGLKPSRDEMLYTVTENDLSKFVTEMDEISGEDLVKMQEEARDRVISYLVSRYNVTTAEYQGAYLMVPKKENWNSYNTKSFLYFVFKTSVKKNDDSMTDKWLVVSSSDIRKVKQSDEASDIYDESADNKVFDITEFGRVYEYDSMDDLYNDLVLRRSDYERDPEYKEQ